MKKIKGDIGQKLKQDLIPMTVFGLIMLFIIFGKFFLNIMFFYVIIINLIILYLSITSDYYDFFYIDEKNECIVKNGNYIYFRDIDKVILLKHGDIYDFQLLTNGQYLDIVKGVGKPKKAYFESIMDNYHINEISQEKGIGNKRRMTLLIGIFVIVVLVYLIGLKFLYKISPNLTKNSKKLELNQEEYLDKKYKKFYWLNYHLNDNYKEVYSNKELISYKSDDTIVKLELGEEIFARNEKNNINTWLLKVTGIENNYKITKKIENAQYGIFYLLMKLLINGNVIKSQTWQTENFELFIKYKKFKGKEEANIIIFEKGTKDEINITIITDENLENKVIDFIKKIKIIN